MAKTPGQIFGERVQTARKRQSLTQPELAEQVRELGVWMTRSTLAKIETGIGRPVRLEEVVAIAEALQLSPRYLLEPETDDDVELVPGRVVAAGDWRPWLIGTPLSHHDRDKRLPEMSKAERDRLALLDVTETVNPVGQLHRDAVLELARMQGVPATKESADAAIAEALSNHRSKLTWTKEDDDGE